MTTPAPTPDPTTQPTPTPAAQGGNPTAPTPTPRSFTEEELNSIIADRLARQQRAIDAKTAKDRADAEAVQLAEQGRYKELAEAAEKKAAALEATLAQRDHADLQRAVAQEHKLPADLASRLQGTTKDELVADAKALSALIPPPTPTPEPAPPTPGTPTAPRPAGAQQGGKDAEYDRLKATGKYRI